MGWQGWGLLSAVFAAATAIAIKASVAKVEPDTAMAVRAIIIAILAAIYLATTGKWRGLNTFTARDVVFLCVAAACAFVALMCYFSGLKVGPLSQVSALDRLSLVIVALAGILIFREHPTKCQWIGLIMVTGGVTILTFSPLIEGKK